MSSLLFLAVIGVIESVVYLLRYRTAHHPSHWVSAFWGGMIAATRLVFVWAGVLAVLTEASKPAALLAYVVPVILTTAWLHASLERAAAKGGAP